MAGRLIWLTWMSFWTHLIFQLTCPALSHQMQAVECKRKSFPLATSYVCVCNATYCDTVQGISNTESGMFVSVTSDKDQHRFSKDQQVIAVHSNITNKNMLITVNSSEVYQTILGFGGAFTDSATMNILNVSSKVQDHLLRSYFSIDGIEYTTGRIPMASTDFSLGEYSYDDVPNDFALQNFSLAKEDIKYKIPIIQRSLAMSKKPIRLFAAPWSAPAWMKTNGQMSGKGQLKGQAGDKYHKTWANYFIKFLDEYKKNNLTMWGISVENEPSAGGTDNKWQAQYYTAEMEGDFVKTDLGPALNQAGYGDVNLMILDDQRLFLPDYVKGVLSDADAAKYVSGIAVHWYFDFFFDLASRLTATHNMFPNMFLLATEACNGYLPDSPAVVLGSWERGESYSHDIIQDLSNWVAGWTDWNLALNMDGGPNWAKNNVDSPIIVDAKNDVFYKQPMFYHLGHFSKFILPGSVHIGLTTSKDNELESIAFKLPDGKTLAVVVLNRFDEAKYLSIHDPSAGYINAKVPARSIQTYLWTSGQSQQ
ncbi:lysosomal acid glucosylceramidase-like [Patiria miniata]|uniref:Glucosylceramidase n=1 Tax=Patiria miniata TaxID=46514 RepID=A0A913YXK9_PATMI|nr:lysosomal acid glucosylceramidase-like [Patiria miniata]XP_038044274.1 lysosomal acid glucosylceramidase-like [Patiria miniata]XP_038044275.1 lysosomal acid glucosylceramidase-like [Patiria miniata]